MSCAPHYRHAFFFNDTATTEIYTLSLHDALPISRAFVLYRQTGLRSAHPSRSPDPEIGRKLRAVRAGCARRPGWPLPSYRSEEQRLNSSHQIISYAVFCLKKKKTSYYLTCL